MNPHDPARRRSTHAPGALAVRLAIVALATLFASIAANTARDALPDALRIALGVVFAISSFGAAILASRSIIRGERTRALWFALTIGVLSSLLVLAEFTVLE